MTKIESILKPITKAINKLEKHRDTLIQDNVEREESIKEMNNKIKESEVEINRATSVSIKLKELIK